MNHNTLICLDFETGNLEIKDIQPIQVAAKAFHPRTLQPIAGTRGEFCSDMKPTDFSKISQKALDINKRKIEDLEKAPEQKVVWSAFAEWVNSFNYRKDIYSAPIAIGKNIHNFDMPIVQILSEKYGFVDKNGKQNLFNQVRIIDLDDFMFYFFENSEELKNIKMDTLREYFGLSKENGHEALCDVKQTAELVLRFMKVVRNTSKKIKFKGSLANVA